jgi:hypothetical protein
VFETPNVSVIAPMEFRCHLTFDMSGGGGKRSLLDDVRSMEGLGSRYMRRKNACYVRCAEAAKPKLTLSMLDYDDPREPTELTPHRPDRGQRNVNRLEPSVKCGIHAVGCKRKGIDGDFDSAADPQAANSFARTMDSSGNQTGNSLRRLSIREQRVAQLVDQELVHQRDLCLT